MSEREIRRVVAAVELAERVGRADGLAEWVAGMECLPASVRRRELRRALGGESGTYRDEV